MLKPVNGHVLIEPIVYEEFTASQKETYEEIGVVVAVAADLITVSGSLVARKPVEVGEKVYFDAWLAAKYPNGADKFYWLIKWEDIRAIEHVEQEIPKQ